MIRTSTLTGLRAPTGSTSPSWMARNSLTCAAAGNSPTSSRNNVPPEASTNFPTWRSVAPVNEPFSWPNRIDSTRFSGMAPQLTAMNGLARRSPEPWMARAINSLPTPDLPAISTGMVEAAAFSAMRSTAVHARALGDDVGKAERAGAAVLDARELAFERAGVERVAQADLQAFGADRLDHEIDRAGAHRRDDIVDAAVRGLHDHRHIDRSLAQSRQDAETVEVRHHQIEDHAIDPRAVGAGEQRQRGVAVVEHARSRSRIFAACPRGAGTAPDRHRR